MRVTLNHGFQLKKQYLALSYPLFVLNVVLEKHICLQDRLYQSPDSEFMHLTSVVIGGTQNGHIMTLICV